MCFSGWKRLFFSEIAVYIRDAFCARVDHVLRIRWDCKNKDAEKKHAWLIYNGDRKATCRKVSKTMGISSTLDRDTYNKPMYIFRILNWFLKKICGACFVSVMNRFDVAIKFKTSLINYYKNKNYICNYFYFFSKTICVRLKYIFFPEKLFIL